ncbi:MAG: RlmF-related methyltransferase [Bacteroidales bacterium]|nr:RlmF-related methyltransferase [Bacteroidales bacterium]
MCLSVCNPPFHASTEEAQAVSVRKLTNLKGEKPTKPVLNFGGQSNPILRVLTNC